MQKGNGMKDFLGVVLLGVGGYILYEWLMSSATIAQATAQPLPTGTTIPPVTTSNTTQNQVTGSTSGNQAGANNTPNTNQQLLMAQVLQAAKNNTIMQSQVTNGVYVGSVSQWNYLLTQVTGSENDLIDYPGDTGGNIDIGTYFTWRNNAGLSGLGRVYMSGFGTTLDNFHLRGLGRIGQGFNINANRINSDASAYELADKIFG